MSRRSYEVTVEVVVDEPTPGIPLFRVLNYAGIRELWVYPSDTGELLAAVPVASLGVCRLSRSPSCWPPLTAIVDRAFPGARQHGVVLWDEA